MNYFKNNRVLLLVIAALILVNLCLLYYGFIDRDKHEGFKGPITREEMMKRTKKKLKEEVGFTDEQLKQYEQLRMTHFDSLDPKFEELGKAKENFLNLLFQSNVSDSAISAASEKICEQQKSIDEQMLRHFMSLRKLATEDQKPKLDSFLQKITRRMSGRGRNVATKQDSKN
jgi:Spy/CpxP family protein refolding chaperone